MKKRQQADNNQVWDVVVRCMLSPLQTWRWWKQSGNFSICQHPLDPRLVLHAHGADKLLMQELHNIISKQHPQMPQSLFNTLTRVGAHALHGSKIKD